MRPEMKARAFWLPGGEFHLGTQKFLVSSHCPVSCDILIFVNHFFSTMLFTEKNLRLGGSVQFKPVLLKGQLRFSM